MSDQLSKLDTILLESTDEAMKEVFGETVRGKVLGYLSHGFSTGDFSSHVQQVRSGLTELLGPGAQPLESLILENLSIRLKTDISFETSILDRATKQC